MPKRKSRRNSTKASGGGGNWVTINGTPVLIGEDGKPKGKIGKKIMSTSKRGGRKSKSSQVKETLSKTYGGEKAPAGLKAKIGKALDKEAAKKASKRGTAKGVSAARERKEAKKKMLADASAAMKKVQGKMKADRDKLKADKAAEKKKPTTRVEMLRKNDKVSRLAANLDIPIKDLPVSSDNKGWKALRADAEGDKETLKMLTGLRKDVGKAEGSWRMGSMKKVQGKMKADKGAAKKKMLSDASSTMKATQGKMRADMLRKSDKVSRLAANLDLPLKDIPSPTDNKGWRALRAEAEGDKETLKMLTGLRKDVRSAMGQARADSIKKAVGLPTKKKLSKGAAKKLAAAAVKTARKPKMMPGREKYTSIKQVDKRLKQLDGMLKTKGKIMPSEVAKLREERERLSDRRGVLSQEKDMKKRYAKRYPQPQKKTAKKKASKKATAKKNPKGAGDLLRNYDESNDTKLLKLLRSGDLTADDKESLFDTMETARRDYGFLEGTRAKIYAHMEKNEPKMVKRVKLWAGEDDF